MFFLLLFFPPTTIFCIIHINTITNVYSVCVFTISSGSSLDSEIRKEPESFSLPYLVLLQMRYVKTSLILHFTCVTHTPWWITSFCTINTFSSFPHCRLTVLAVNENLILVQSRWSGIRPVMWSRNTEKHQTQFSIRPQRRMHTKWQQGSIQCPPQKRESWSIRSNHTMYN